LAWNCLTCCKGKQGEPLVGGMRRNKVKKRTDDVLQIHSSPFAYISEGGGGNHKAMHNEVALHRTAV
jgi:hypothetical protein